MGVGQGHRRQQGLGVRVARMRLNSADGASSTIDPRYITAMRRQRCATTLRSWEIKM